MKIAFFGTPEFAWEILSWILEYPEIECKLVVSQPDKPVGRKKEMLPTPVKQVALDNSIEVIQPIFLKNPPNFDHNSVPLNKGEDVTQWSRGIVEILKSLDLDFIVVVAYGKIIPKEILDIPKYGCINIHGSILPKYRWASPVQAAVKAGDKQTWLTTMYMSAGMDEWDILKIAKVDIDNVDTSQDIFKKFIQIWPELLASTLREITSGDLQWSPQDDSQVTYCGKISREDGEVFFKKQSAQEIYNTYRAYTPWPGIYTWYEGKRLVLEALTPTLSQREKEQATNGQKNAALLSSEGQVREGTQWLSRSWSEAEEIQRWGSIWEFIKLSKNRYGIICTDKKILEIHRVKLEGKKSMDIMSFVNGNREVVWYVFA